MSLIVNNAVVSSLLVEKHSPKTWVWKYFRKYSEMSSRDKKEEYVVCTECLLHRINNNVEELMAISSSEIKYGQKKSTSHMKDHMRSKHHDIFEFQNHLEALENANKRKLEDGNDQHHGMDLYIKWICSNYMPVNTIEQPEFREFLHYYLPDQTWFSHKEVMSRIDTLAYNARLNLKTNLKGIYFSLTCDHWTSNDAQSFVSVTIHYIDHHYKYHSQALCCKPHIGSSKSQHLVSELTSILNTDYNIDDFKKYCVCVVSDTAPNMTKFGRLLMEEQGIHWHGCACHILDLISKGIFESPRLPTPLREILPACRDIVSFFHGSAQGTERLHRAQNTNIPLTLVQDVSTRWWSTYNMVSRLLQLKIYIRLVATEGAFKKLVDLTDYQWTVLEKITYILKPFMETQKLLEGETYITASLILNCITHLRNHLKCIVEDGSEDADKKLIAEVALADFKEYWGDESTLVTQMHTQTGIRNRFIGIPLLCLFASYLDIRTKSLSALTVHERIDLVEQLKLWILNQTDIGIAGEHNTDRTCNVNKPQVQSCTDHHSIMSAFSDTGITILSETNAVIPSPQQKSREERLNDELQMYGEKEFSISLQYKNEVTMEDEYYDPIGWWETQHSYPMLKAAAQRILPIPASDSPSERTFSRGGRIKSKDRNKLSGLHTDEIVFLGNCFASGIVDVFDFRQHDLSHLCNSNSNDKLI
jgi:hypothetical protein